MVVMEDRRVYGNTYQRGFKEAQENIIIMGDADFTYPFEMTPKFMKEILKGYDFEIEDRLNGMMEADAMPALHRYIGTPPLLKCLTSYPKTRNTHCGMRAITREALQRLNLKRLGWEFTTEKNLRIKQIPIPHRK
ncbi:glycosyltransferase [Methanothermobacter tenebrarum]|uniref:glycosyltransferase n=1 Tax=Methanothermobacter tenebrarum TaxID=680118 RepID=UPI0015EC8F7D|nr:glycosyltransferase [Methanothermobacter tenebrarum]